MAVHAVGQHQIHVFLEGIGGQGDDRHASGVGPVHGADGFGRGVAVHPGHLQIHENQVIEVDGRACEHRHGFGSVRGLIHPQTQVRKLFNDDDAVYLHVIHEQNALARQGCRAFVGGFPLLRGVVRFLEPEQE